MSDALNLLKNARGDLAIIAGYHYVPMLCPINPRTSHLMRSTYAYRKCLSRSRRPVESDFAVWLHRDFRQWQTLRQPTNEVCATLNGPWANGFCTVAIPVRFGTFCR